MAELLSAPLAPFTGALALLLALFLLEIIMLLVGGSLFAGGDAPDLDIDTGIDLATEADAPSGTSAGGVMAALGLGEAPLMVWVASFLLAFGLWGVVTQLGMLALIDAPLPPWAAVPIAALAGVGFARRFSRFFGRLLPQNYTESVSETELGRRRGVITVGTASRGRPAEVRVTDRHGNIQYLRAEPMQDGITLAQGTEVLVLRDPRSRSYRLIPLA